MRYQAHIPYIWTLWRLICILCLIFQVTCVCRHSRESRTCNSFAAPLSWIVDGWDIILLASHTLTTLDLSINECRYLPESFIVAMVLTSRIIASLPGRPNEISSWFESVPVLAASQNSTAQFISTHPARISFYHSIFVFFQWHWDPGDRNYLAWCQGWTRKEFVFRWRWMGLIGPVSIFSKVWLPEQDFFAFGSRDEDRRKLGKGLSWWIEATHRITFEPFIS